jgi:phospholipid/cholesterol/gamma-HCH transport system ATP-binding protein
MLIQLKNLRKRFGPLVVLDDVSIDIPAGQSIVILGASGSGKSVLLKHLVGLLAPDSGEVWFDGLRIDTMPQKQLMEVRQRLGFLFQGGALFDSMTVAENVAFPLVEHTHRTKPEIAEIVQRKLNQIGLPDVGPKFPGQLSGGQRKRVALARAIALDPQVIVYDEPTTGLDPIRSDVINELILKLQRELNITSITVTHDMNSAFKVADRIVMLNQGKIIQDGPPETYRHATNPIVKRFVAGEADETELAGLR